MWPQGYLHLHTDPDLDLYYLLPKYQICLFVCVSVCVFVQGWRPNRSSDCHQTWQGVRRTILLCLRDTEIDVTQPDMTSHDSEWWHPCSSGLSESPLGQGNCPIATKFGTDIQWLFGMMIKVPKMTSQNRKWPSGTGSDPLKQEVRPHRQRNDLIATKPGTDMKWEMERKIMIPEVT